MRREYKRQRPHKRVSCKGKGFGAGRGRVTDRPLIIRGGKHAGYGPVSDAFVSRHPVTGEYDSDNIDFFNVIKNQRGRVFQAEHDIGKSYEARGSVTPKASSSQVNKFEDIDAIQDALMLGLDDGNRDVVNFNLGELSKFSKKDLVDADNYFFDKERVEASSRFSPLFKRGSGV